MNTMLKSAFKGVLACSLFTLSMASIADKPMPAASAGVNESVAAETLAAKLDAYQSLSGNYSQMMTGKDGKMIQSIEGTFKLKRPGLYYWQSEDPYPQTIVSNGKQVWLYDPDLEQVTITQTEQLGFNPSSFLAGDIRKELGAYQVSANGERFTLTPLAENAPFDALYLAFTGDLLNQASYTDKLGQTTSLTFSKVVKNPTITKKTFEFEVPAGTDIVTNE